MKDEREDFEKLLRIKEVLSEGMIVKNYKELCFLLGEDVRDGNSKKAQEKEWERFFKFSKKGYKLIIEEIYEKPLSLEPIKGNNSIYIDDIEDILLNYLHSISAARVSLSFSKLLNILGLVNTTYSVGNCRKRAVSEVLNIELKAVHYFYNNSRSGFKTIIERALDNLKKRSVINYHKGFCICKEEDVLDDNGGVISKYTYIQATADEESLILDAQEKALVDDLKVETFQQLFMMGTAAYRKYIKAVMERLPSHWVFYFNTYNITMGKSAVERKYNNMLIKREQLNLKSIDKLIKSLKVVDNNSVERKMIDSMIDISAKDIDKLSDEIVRKDNKIKQEYYSKIQKPQYHVERLNEVIRQKEQEIEDAHYDNVTGSDIVEYNRILKNKRDNPEVYDDYQDIDIEQIDRNVEFVFERREGYGDKK